jgi:uncharacterized protein involved in exopolysaccharide biosynthesis
MTPFTFGLLIGLVVGMFIGVVVVFLWQSLNNYREYRRW